MMVELPTMKGLRRIIRLLDILETLARSKECRPVATKGFTAHRDTFDQQRMDRVCQYINQRLEEPMKIAEVARLVHLSEGSFSRFFRAHAGKTFPQFVNELRVGRASRLLIETDLPITSITYRCGFSDPAYFHRVFQQRRGIGPGAYRKRFETGER